MTPPSLQYFDAHTHVQRVGWEDKHEKAVEASNSETPCGEAEIDKNEESETKKNGLSAEILTSIREGEASGVVGFTCCSTSPEDWRHVELVYGENLSASSSVATSSATSSPGEDAADQTKTTSASSSSPPSTLVIPFLGVHPWWAHTVDSVEGDESNRLFRGKNPPHNAAKLERKRQFEEAQRKKREEKEGNLTKEPTADGRDPANTESAEDRANQRNVSSETATSTATPSGSGTNWLHLLEQKLKSDPSIQVGEIGLDKPRKKVCPLDRQKEVFRAQLRLAGVYKRHIQVHAVGTGGAVLEELKNSGQLFGFPKSSIKLD